MCCVNRDDELTDVISECAAVSARAGDGRHSSEIEISAPSSTYRTPALW